eukprot:2957794-Pyramimonas_sp.AAC.1
MASRRPKRAPRRPRRAPRGPPRGKQKSWMSLKCLKGLAFSPLPWFSRLAGSPRGPQAHPQT